MSASIAMSRTGPGPAGAVKAVSVVSTGTVQIRPEHPYGTRKPLYWWLATSRRWTPPRPINVYVIEHSKGLILFDTGQDRASVTDAAYFPGGVTGVLYDRLARFGPPPHLEPRQFATRGRWAANFGGVRTGHTYNSMGRGLLASLLRSPDYSLADTVRAFRGITAARAALLPELAALDLPHTLTRLSTPIVMAQGRHDQVAPPAAAERYAGSLQAPHKQPVWFEHSAHMPHFEEPERFRQLLAQVRLGLPAKT
jgi:pimeloyl-ACP methyl ester carboxylesterase